MADINLAHLLVDGEQIVVGAPAAVRISSGGKSATKVVGKSSTVIVHINSATEAQLKQLLGIGPVMAQKILAYRKAHGPFTAIDQVASVPGFGRKRFDAIAQQLRL